MVIDSTRTPTGQAGPAAPATAVIAPRALGLVADVVVASAVSSLLGRLPKVLLTSPEYGGTTPTGAILGVVAVGLVWLAVFVAVPTLQGGRTLGMSLVGVRVVRADGGVPHAGRHLVRFLLLAVDGLGVGLVGLLVMTRSRDRRRLGDMAAGTVVVREEACTFPGVPVSR